MKKRIKIPYAEIKELLGSPSFDFPKYTTQLLNLANQNAQATRPAIVGQMSELIQEFSGQSISEWEEWYLEKHPQAIENATQKIKDMVKNLKTAIDLIDDTMIADWVKDLVIIKTFIGLRFQEAILNKVASFLETSYALASPEQESKGIDGMIGGQPVSIKPDSYKSKKTLPENIPVKIIYYSKTKDGLLIDLEEFI